MIPASNNGARAELEASIRRSSEASSKARHRQGVEVEGPQHQGGRQLLHDIDKDQQHEPSAGCRAAWAGGCTRLNTRPGRGAQSACALIDCCSVILPRPASTVCRETARKRLPDRPKTSATRVPLSSRPVETPKRATHPVVQTVVDQTRQRGSLRQRR